MTFEPVTIFVTPQTYVAMKDLYHAVDVRSIDVDEFKRQMEGLGLPVDLILQSNRRGMVPDVVVGTEYGHFRYRMLQRAAQLL